MNGEMAASHANVHSVCMLCARKCPHSWSGRQLGAIANALCIVIALAEGYEMLKFRYNNNNHCDNTICFTDAQFLATLSL